MYVRTSRKILIAVLAVAVMMTSSIGAFAASSPTKGTVGNDLSTVVKTDDNTITISWSGNASQYVVFVNGKEAGTTPNTSFVYQAEEGKTYDIYVQPLGNPDSRTTVAKRWIKATKKMKAKKVGKKKVKVSWKKVKNVKNYRIEAYKNGVLVKTWTAKKSATSKTVKVPKKGKYEFRVIPIYKNGDYRAMYRKKTVKL